MIRNLFKLVFYPLLGNIRGRHHAEAMVDPQLPDPTHANRVHLFHGTFETELAATSYCLDTPGKNEPEPLTRDLPDAMIDTSEVEIIFGGARIAAAVPMLTHNPHELFNEIGADNTVILIAEAAFGGLPYTLNDTPVLRYAGAYNVT